MVTNVKSALKKKIFKNIQIQVTKIEMDTNIAASAMSVTSVAAVPHSQIEMEKKSAKGVKRYGLVVMYSQENVMVVVMRVIRLENGQNSKENWIKDCQKLRQLNSI